MVSVETGGRETNGSPVLNWTTPKIVFENPSLTIDWQAKALAANLAANGWPLRTIAIMLSKSGFNGVSGKPYGPQSIKGMLKANIEDTSLGKGWYIYFGDIKIGPFHEKVVAERMVPVLHRAAVFSGSRPNILTSNADHLEMARIILALTEAGVTQKDIARIMGRKTSWVCFINKLNKMPKTLISYVNSGIISVSTAIKASEEFGEKEIEAAVMDLTKRHATGNSPKITRDTLFDHIRRIGG